MYGYEGVCCVRFVGHPSVPGLNKEKEYYLLESVRHKSQIYTPVDTKMTMRLLTSAAELNSALDTLSSRNELPELPPDAKTASEFYRNILQKLELTSMLQLYQALLLRQKRQMEIRKTLSTTDQRYLKQTEELLCSEIGFVLNLANADCLRMLREKCK